MKHRILWRLAFAVLLAVAVRTFPVTNVRAQDEAEHFLYLPLIMRSPDPDNPWQRYRMLYVIKIGGVNKLWMPVPREWDGIGVKDVEILEIFPQPTDHYRDPTGNEMVFWQIDDPSSREYGVIFKVSVGAIAYQIDPDNVGDYDTSSDLYRRYAAPSEWIQSDHPEIIALARDIVGSETNPYRQAQLLHLWVSTNLSGGGDCKTSLEALHNRLCGCDGFSFLYVALLRSLGIPARTVKGWHTGYQGEFTSGEAHSWTFYQHHWSEFYLPSYAWIQSDASAGNVNFAGINEPRIVTARGENILLGHNYPLGPTPWFNAPQVDLFLNSGTPKTQTWGEYFKLEVERLW